MSSNEIICLWRILDKSHKILLGLCVYIFGIIGLILNIWLVYAFMKSRLLTFKSHLLLFSLCIASAIKTSLTGFLIFGSSALAGRWVFGTSTCFLFAFLRQLLGVVQIMLLTVIAVERYIVNRPKQKNVSLPLWFYVSGIFISWFMAAIFSLPPLLGYGAYGCDVTGTICDLDWRMLTPRQVAFNIFVIVFTGCVPIFIIFTCLWGANCSDIKKVQFKSFDETSFTKTITVMTSIIFLLWTPQAILSLWIFIQNIHPPRGIPVALSVIAPISVEAAEIIPILCYLTYDLRLRSGLLEICEIIRRKYQTRKLTKILSIK